MSSLAFGASSDFTCLPHSSAVSPLPGDLALFRSLFVLCPASRSCIPSSHSGSSTPSPPTWLMSWWHLPQLLPSSACTLSFLLQPPTLVCTSPRLKHPFHPSKDLVSALKVCEDPHLHAGVNSAGLGGFRREHSVCPSRWSRKFPLLYSFGIHSPVVPSAAR